MNTNRTFFGIACRVAAFSFLMAGTASLIEAQQLSPATSAPQAPLFLASESTPLDLTSTSSSSSSSNSSSSPDDATPSYARLNLDALPALDSSQPPPRRTYGRPHYSGGNTNPDGSNKFTFMVGGGASVPVGITHKYDTPSWNFQGGGGRNWSKTFGVLLQFDYDHLGLQGATIKNQAFIYDYGCPAGTVAAGTCGVSGLDGNSHVWSFTLDPTFTLPTEGSIGAYAVAGVGFYHKVTNFTEPATGEYCDYYGFCYQYTANQVIDHYTSNAPGVNAGLGVTFKFSKFSNEKFYAEARYVVVFNTHYNGITASNVATSTYTGYNFYPANSNRTTYIPITFGLRF